MTLQDFISRVAQAAKRLKHYSATITLSERRIKRWRAAYLAAAKVGNQPAIKKARARIIYWKARKLRAEDLRRNWRDLLKRRRQQKATYQKNHPPVDADGFADWVNPDGTIVSVAPWMVGLADSPGGIRHNWLDHAKRLGWSGYINSGVRTAAHSIELCYSICEAPTCAGRCAGGTSNHNCADGCPSPQGAIDVQDYYKFGAIMSEIGAPLQNQLPIDPVHYSYTGH